jgi:hypothetical protein
VKTGIVVFNEHGFGTFKGTYGESYNEQWWYLFQHEDGHFEFLNGVDRFQISFLSTTTFIVTYDNVLLGGKKGTITFKRIK